MVVHDLYIFRVPAGPTKADPPLVVHANAVLPPTVPREALQTVSRRDTEVFNRFRRTQQQEALQRRSTGLPRESPRTGTSADLLGLLVAEGSNHILSITHNVNIVKRHTPLEQRRT